MTEIEKDVRICIKRTPHGAIETISCQEFQSLFGVEWAQTLRFSKSFPARPKAHKIYAAPEESQRAERKLQYGLALGRKDAGAAVDSLRNYRDWLYADAIRNAEVADVYLMKVNDIVGYGVFANSGINPGDLIGEYTGLVRRDGDIAGDHDFSYALGYPWMADSAHIDAKQMGNYTRFVNHSSDANCSTMRVVVDGVSREAMIAVRPIARGEQVLFDYGAGYWQYRQLTPVDMRAESAV